MYFWLKNDDSGLFTNKTILEQLVISVTVVLWHPIWAFLHENQDTLISITALMSIQIILNRQDEASLCPMV